MNVLLALARRDWRSIVRDGFLVMLVGYSLVIAVACRFVVRLVPIEHIELYVAPFVLLTSCSLLGIIFGFALIEERETQTWLLLRVVPIPRGTLLGYWVGVGSAVSFVVGMLCAAIYGVRPGDLVSWLLLMAITALAAPLIMLLLGLLASNKIEGLAVGKILSGSSLLLIAVFVLPPGGQLLLAWYPWYWVYVGLLRAYAGPDRVASLAVQWPPVPDWSYPVAAFLLTAVAIVIVYRRRSRTI